MLSVSAEPDREGGSDVRELSARRLIVACGSQVQHIAIDAGQSWLRMDVVTGDALVGLVRPVLHLRDDDALAFKIESLSRWMRLTGAVGAARWRPRSDRRLARLVEALRVGDALADGASLREIAAVLRAYGSRAFEWPGAGDSIKSWVRRRVDLARRLRAAGPSAVLHHSV